MYISKIDIQGFRFFNEKYTVSFNKGITVLVGENGSGKSAVIDSIRLLLGEDEYNRSGISSTDFHKPFSQDENDSVDNIKISCIFEELTDFEQVAYLPWLDPSNLTQAKIQMQATKKEDSRGRIRKAMWGGSSKKGIFEWELINLINCVYLPPLRNAEEKMNSYRGSRLVRLLNKLNDLDPDDSALEDTVKRQNEELLQDPLIQKTNELIKKCIIESVGDILGQDVSIQFSEQTFNKIINQLRLLFFPEIHEDNPSEVFRELSENSLGYNNLLYIATIIAEMEAQKDISTTSLKILLVEELEAHLHPQLQTRLLQYLLKASIKSNIQIIITTHSPTIAAAVGLDSIVVMTPLLPSGERKSIKIADCGLNPKTKLFLERWLDITKSLLLFSKGVILVEGISEAILFPEFVKRVLGEKSLEDYGISVININGIYFKQFMQLFSGYILSQKEFKTCDKIPIRCVGITDCDPKNSAVGETDGQMIKNCGNSQCGLVNDLKNNTSNCRLYINSKTFEYDLCLTGNNLAILNSALSNIIETDGPIKNRANIAKNTDWRLSTSCEKIVESLVLLNRIENSKGKFAQELAYLLSSNRDADFEVPSYIKNAILFVTGDSDG